MNQPNKLMPLVQAIAAGLILALFAVLAVGPMLGLSKGDQTLVETVKAVVLILVGFLYGTSVSGGKKDETIAAMAPQQPKEPAP